MYRKRQGCLVPLGLGLLAQLHPRTRDGEPVFIKQLLDLHYRLHVALAVHALPGAAFYWLELRKFGLPEAKYVGRQAAQAGNFADAEIELVRNNDIGVVGFLRSFLSEAHVRRLMEPLLYSCIRVSSTSRAAGQPPKVRTGRRNGVLTLP